MKQHVLLPLAALAIAVAHPATATDFDTRIARANAAIATPAGYAYDMALVPAIHAATVECVPPGRRAASRADVFTTVASVDATGRVSNVQVRPATPLSQCFARQLGAMRLQPPPGPVAAGGHPILIRVRETF
jgi:hypothetical protein